jgi:hypothetical protein
VLVREALTHLAEGEAGPTAVVDLGEPLVRDELEPAPGGHRLGGAEGTLCRGRQERRRLQRRQRLGRDRGLLPSDVVERRVELTLETALGVVGRAAVAEDDELAVPPRWLGSGRL